ncbi:hypothetical protein D3OALGA1CA_3541 [Olavius algarvensis associated proteobacterium Delta 3]|nr:hypothetical protein D3OALGB2SA_2331 [Olavius algarvensis associated proteobacterium Delta 3]CAB5135985.1 hypothetical protein D3OALGA1CA_3541 [Olavius algarvensis associated proteobacterium Delta 3]
MDIRWVAFPLHPETPREGRTLEDLFAGRPIDVGLMMDRLRTVAREEGLPFGDRKMTYNSRLAQELGKWAESMGRGDDFHAAAFRAYFVDGQNLAEPDVLTNLACSVGLPEEDARQVLTVRTFKDPVDSDWQKSYEHGITAVPTLELNGTQLVGFQPYAEMVQFVQINGVRPRP